MTDVAKKRGCLGKIGFGLAKTAGILAAATLVAIGLRAGGPSIGRWIDEKQKKQTPAHSPAIDRAAADKLKADVEQMVLDGQLHSVDWVAHELRISPAIWDSMDVDKKRTVLRGFQSHYVSAGQPAQVTIKSSKNDDVFASASSLGGERIVR